MTKKTRYKGKRDARKRATVLETAEIAGVSVSLVEKVLKADRNNEKVLSVFMEITERHNELLQDVKDLVPFN